MGRQHGHQFCVGNLRGDDGESLSVNIRSGVWRDFASDDGGSDPVSLYAAINGFQQGEAKDRLAEDLGMAIDGRICKHRFALDIWKATQDPDRTEVGTYLRQVRRIRLPIPPTLRFHANIKHYHTGLFFPAMVAGVQSSNGEVIAVHRTYLQSDGHGKALVSNPKMALGSLAYGAVRLAPPERALGLAEGIETGLSAQQLFEIPVWAVLSCGRFATLAIPAEVIEVQIFADNGDAGRAAARKAAEHWTARGKRVVIRRPPDPFSDWNDALPHWHERPVGAWEF